jgi:hypothetical protein
MEQIDNRVLNNVSDEELLLSTVVCDDAELLYLDSLLSTIFKAEA